MKTTKEDRQRTCDAYPNSYYVRAIVDDLEAAEAEIARLREQTQWRPIETAPKDGSLILGWDNKVMRGKGAECVMLWARNEHTQKHEWMNFWNAYRVDNPRHWMPLPQPPQDAPIASHTIIRGINNGRTPTETHSPEDRPGQSGQTQVEPAGTPARNH